jgi:hypothetical protein
VSHKTDNNPNGVLLDEPSIPFLMTPVFKSRRPAKEGIYNGPA